MTVKDLREILKRKPLDMPVVLVEWDGKGTFSSDLNQACNVEYQKKVGEIWLVKQRGSERLSK